MAGLVNRCCAMIWSMRDSQLYNAISSTYAVTRRQDDRVAAQDLPSPEDLGDLLDIVEVATIAVPFDCTDGFGAAFWGRPDAYLDADVQQGMSWLAQLPPHELAEGASRLELDLRSGEWDRRYGHLRDLDELDVGYRLVVAESS